MSFVEWKEEFISQERGRRVVHYILKDSCGDSVLAVVGTERSLRHMVYVVADEFLNVYGAENATQSGFKWRSRREVVDWLTSMLCKQQLQQDSPRSGNAKASESSKLLFDGFNDHSASKVIYPARSLKQPSSDIRWLGVSWACNKQLKHYPAFCRNSTTISIQSFVFVMAKEDNRYLAYLEDMYEDKKGLKKVRVRWFHHCQEIKGKVRVQNNHPKEVFFTPYAQVISVECVDGPAIILTREHFEKCLDRFPHTVLTRIHLCFRQFRTNRIRPFDLSKLRGYFNQPILSLLESNNAPLNPDIIGCSLAGDEIKALYAGEDVTRGTKRTRNYSEQSSFLTVHSGAQFYRKQRKKITFEPLCEKNKIVESRSWHGCIFKVGGKIELLCQDSGIRGCWFRCTIRELSRKQMKVQYDDLDDQDGSGKLEEWVQAFRLATPDKLGMRCTGRPIIRPLPPPTDQPGPPLKVGAPVDAWWSDGWWEGVVTEVRSSEEDKIRVLIAAENLYLEVSNQDLRVSRDWVEGQWIDIKPKENILSAISSSEIKPSTTQDIDHESSDGINDSGSDDVSMKQMNGSDVADSENNSGNVGDLHTVIVNGSDNCHNTLNGNSENNNGIIEGNIPPSRECEANEPFPENGQREIAEVGVA